MRFLLIDRITEWRPGCSAVAEKNVALSEDCFEDHFPARPIMPGALIVEGMAQLAGLLIEEGVRRDTGRQVKALMSIIEKAKFRRTVHPGEQLRYAAEVLSVNELGGRAAVQATVGGERTAEARLVFTFHQVTDPFLAERRRTILDIWLRNAVRDA